MARCSRCGEYFYREPHEKWKRLCLDCWLDDKRKREEDGQRRERQVEWLESRIDKLEDENEALRRQLSARMLPASPMNGFLSHFPALIRFCHPDRNPGDPTAHELTVWLLDAREALKNENARVGARAATV